METVTLDGKQVTMEELKEKMKDHTIKIIEVSPGQYKTLQSLKG